MTTQSNTATAAAVEFPSGVRPVTLHGKAESWEAWHALTAEDGWEESCWPVEANTTYPAGVHSQKEGEIRGHRIVVFPPQQLQTVESQNV